MEAPKSTFMESTPSKKFLNYIALMSSIMEEAAQQRVWRKAMMKNDVWISCQDRRENQIQVVVQGVPYLLKREYDDNSSNEQVLPHRSKCLDVWKLSKGPLTLAN